MKPIRRKRAPDLHGLPPFKITELYEGRELRLSRCSYGEGHEHVLREFLYDHNILEGEEEATTYKVVNINTGEARTFEANREITVTLTPVLADYDDAASALCCWLPDDDAAESEALVAANLMVDCLILLDTTTPHAEWAQEVLELFEALPRNYRHPVFRMMDEESGRFRNYTTGEAWHWKLRRTRNHPEYGKRLFAVLAGGAA